MGLSTAERLFPLVITFHIEQSFVMLHAPGPAGNCAQPHHGELDKKVQGRRAAGITIALSVPEFLLACCAVSLRGGLTKPHCSSSSFSLCRRGHVSTLGNSDQAMQGGNINFKTLQRTEIRPADLTTQ